MIKVLIADDENLARKTIRLLLGSQKDITEIYEATNGNEAIETCLKYSPNIIFLDIKMPGKTGIKVAEMIPSETIIIFATAYDKHAITAFELNAVDYLLKPFDDERFYSSLEKARNKLALKTTTDFKAIGQFIREMAADQENNYKNRLVIKDPGRIRLIEIEDINYISGAGNYADIYLIDGTHILHRETLTRLTDQLDPTLFIRIHRSTIVRRTNICELQTNDNCDYTVILKTGQKLTLSRRNKSKIEELLQE